MLASVATFAIWGVDSREVTVEVDVRPGLPVFTVVGLPDAAVREARERVRAAVLNSGLQFPLQRLTANLAPAHVRKAGPSFDLALAVALLAASGQLDARRALEIAAAGGHNLLMIGPPGAGKTMLARRLPGILPPPSFDEALEITRVHSVAGMSDGRLADSRPFRAPHHTISPSGLIGGGSTPRPGEITLAHRGVLFLDELAEFSRPTLEALRQPLEEGVVKVTRGQRSIVFPAAAMLIAACNSC